MDNKKYSDMRKDFQTLYFQKISPWLEQYNNERKIKLFFSILLSLIIGIGGCYLAYQVKSDRLLILSIFLALITYIYVKKTFEDKIKKGIMPQICKCFGNLKWSQKEYNKEKLLSSSNVINNFSSSSYDDIFNGTYTDVDYEIIESSFSTGSGKNKRTVFTGVIIKLDMNKNFTGNTIIKPDTMLHLSPNSNLRHTTLEDVAFEKKFDVYTDDEVEARYLITTTFMERLKSLKTSFKASKISCSFYDKYIFIALETGKDLFTIGSLFKPVNDDKQFFLMFEEILSIIKLIDHFKLDKKLGL